VHRWYSIVDDLSDPWRTLYENGEGVLNLHAIDRILNPLADQIAVKPLDRSIMDLPDEQISELPKKIRVAAYWTIRSVMSRQTLQGLMQNDNNAAMRDQIYEANRVYKSAARGVLQLRMRDTGEWNTGESDTGADLAIQFAMLG
jgi:hypothetical protein